MSQSLLEGLVNRGVGVQGRGTIVHELGGVVRGDRAQVAAVRRVGQAGHHRHHLSDLLLELGDLLLPLVDLACKGREGSSGLGWGSVQQEEAARLAQVSK